MGRRSSCQSPYLDVVPDYEIRDGNMFISAGEVGEPDYFSLSMSLRTFEMGMAKAAAVIAKHRLKQAEVVPIGRGRR